MKKNKIAKSIIIRVGGGIREVRREQPEAPNVIDPVDIEPDFDQSEDLSSFQPGIGSISGHVKNKITN